MRVTDPGSPTGVAHFLSYESLLDSCITLGFKYYERQDRVDVVGRLLTRMHLSLAIRSQGMVHCYFVGRTDGSKRGLFSSIFHTQKGMLFV